MKNWEKDLIDDCKTLAEGWNVGAFNPEDDHLMKIQFGMDIQKLIFKYIMLFRKYRIKPEIDELEKAALDRYPEKDLKQVFTDFRNKYENKIK